ncbi:MAG TPA: TolC family protein, partial [Gemmataceae bacterium]|nr:TolC family protein [Gemmataceae bacterium]
SPESMIVSFAGDIVGPVINKRAIRADYKTANAKQLQAVYGYQRVILNAFTEVVTRVSKVQNYSKSIEIKREQVGALEKSVGLANDLYRFARQGVDYMDVLFAQRDLWTARLNLIETKQEQLSGIVNVYQALGGGLLGCGCGNPRLPQPGPSLSQAPQGGSNPSGTEQLPSPRKLPDYNPTQPGRLPLPSKPPMPLPSPGPTLG